VGWRGEVVGGVVWSGVVYLFIAAKFDIKVTQVSKAVRHTRVVAAIGRFSDLKGLLVSFFGSLKLALFVLDECKTVEVVGHRGMVDAMGGAIYRKGLLGQLLGFDIFALSFHQLGNLYKNKIAVRKTFEHKIGK